MTSRLTQFDIDGLFGLYSHRIPINLDPRITIIIGPNGRGKTVCLKFIEALFRKKFAYFREIPFQVARFRFSNGDVIEVTVKRDATPDERSNATVELALTRPKGIRLTCTPTRLDDKLKKELRKYIPSHWRQIDFDIWQDQSDGEEVDLASLLQRYRMPSRLQTALKQILPDEFENLIAPVDCHLIETQRLLVLQSEPMDVDPWLVRRRQAVRTSSNLAIQEKANKLQAILKDKLTESANLSQSLDRTFPLRVFDAQRSTTLSEEQLREELKLLDEKREALMQAGILDAHYQPVTMPGGQIDRGVVKALEIYVKDATQKLEIFNDLRARVDLFKRLMAERFVDKTIHIDREHGFRITSKTSAPVPLDKLSSGEQHQLILIFDLLFEVTPNSLILIDEPELSLHVAWQKTFITSLEQIIVLNNFDVLLATHSPALVAKHFSLAVELGPVE